MLRSLCVVAATVAVTGLAGSAIAHAAPGDQDKGKARGFLTLSDDGEERVLPPGQAIKAALNACNDAEDTVDNLSVGAVREVGELAVCTGVTLSSRVGGDEDDDTEA